MQKILVVDDDPAIVDLMKDFLEMEGFAVETVHSASEAFVVLERTTVDALLVDLMMPGMNGFDLCRQVRKTSDVPILFLSAREEDATKIVGLGIGGDDYIVKSSSPAEVVARVKAVLRRTNGRKPQPEERSHRLDFGRFVLDLKAHDLYVEGRQVALTPREFELLRLFAEHPRQVFTYEHLLEKFWHQVGDKHTVTVHIGRIREKIEATPAKPLFLVNVWGVGYRFEGVRR
ncbi:response regulator transcription factor [Tumebacillus algifaecis]|nr:response regulator transcription factor [Tumebacillus algifaecis]